jgi:hypothetical protein
MRQAVEAEGGKAEGRWSSVEARGGGQEGEI